MRRAQAHLGGQNQRYRLVSCGDQLCESSNATSHIGMFKTWPAYFKSIFILCALILISGGRYAPDKSANSIALLAKDIPKMNL
jgi:hypothetical protein